MTNKQRHKDLPDWWRRTRLHIALLGLGIAVVNCYAQATFCIAIVEMVLPPDYVFSTDTGAAALVQVSGPIKDSNSATTNTEDLPINQFSAKTISRVYESQPVADLGDQSCPIEYKYRAYYDSWRFPAPNASISLLQGPSQHNNIDITNRFDWDASHQGILLGAFALGTAPLQVFGGRLAEVYGAKWVLLAGCIGTAITNLSIPYLAHSSFILLVINRIIMGISQAGMEPGLMCLLAKWLTPEETGFFISMLLFAICFGFFFGSLCSSFILALGYGWPLAYYASGTLNLFVGLVWFIYADSWPETSAHIDNRELQFILSKQRPKDGKVASEKAQELDHRYIANDLISSPKEQNYISFLTDNSHSNLSVNKTVERQPQASNFDILNRTGSKTKHRKKEQQDTAPWFNILTTPSVWAFIICKISIRWCADVLSIELPTYLANVLHLSIKLNGILNSVSAALFAIFSFLTGYLVNKIVTSNEIEKSRQQPSESSSSSDDDGYVSRCNRRTKDFSFTDINHNSCDTIIDGFILRHNTTGDNKLQSSEGRAQKGLSKTTLRKLFQSCASFGAAMCVFMMTHYDCNILVSMTMLLLLSCCLVMGTGGELQIPYDMTSKYPGTLHGMACTLSVSGWLAPPLIGLILGDQPSSRTRWNIVWYLTASINLIGGLVFVLFADASPRDFDEEKNAKRQEESSPSSIRKVDDLGTGKLSSYQLSTSSPPPRQSEPSKKLRTVSSLLVTAGGGGCFCNNRNDKTGGCCHCSSALLSNNNCMRQQVEQQQQQRQTGKQLSLKKKVENGNYDHDHDDADGIGISNNNNNEDYCMSTQSIASYSPDSYFDEKPIRIRQLEASFVEPSVFYPSHLSLGSVARHTIVFPYIERSK